MAENGRGPMCSSRNSGLLEDPGLKVGHGVVLNRVVHLDRMTANLAVLNEGLASHGRVQHHRNPLPAVRAGKEVLHQITCSAQLNQSVEPPCCTCAALSCFSWSSRQYGAQGIASRRAASIC